LRSIVTTAAVTTGTAATSTDVTASAATAGTATETLTGLSSLIDVTCRTGRIVYERIHRRPEHQTERTAKYNRFPLQVARPEFAATDVNETLSHNRKGRNPVEAPERNTNDRFHPLPEHGPEVTFGTDDWPGEKRG
jgi:hypothetical protein